MQALPQIRIFLSSPGDVADERGLATRIVKEELPYDPFIRGWVTFDLVSWDDAATPTPMPANLTPQEAINRGLSKPSECDFVVVILWSRMGTPLPEPYRKANGERYLSGTEWEFEEALKAADDARKEGRGSKPTILVYRRREVPRIDLTDPDYHEKREQYTFVDLFFENFKNPGGSLARSVVEYETPSQFAERLKNDLRSSLRPIVEDIIRQWGHDKNNTKQQVALEPSWPYPPYPGLRAFTVEEEVIFFGRGNEVDKLIQRLRDPAQRFLAVVGASGTGKSSLVRAGLLPRLTKNAVAGSRAWRVLDFKTGDLENPFELLAVKLNAMLPDARQHQRPREIAERLQNEPEWIGILAEQVLAGSPAWAQLLLFVDQFQDLFTPSVKESYCSPFVAMLASAAASERMRVVVTLRADFLTRAAESATRLPELLQVGTFLLLPPRRDALAEMIRLPAQVAGVTLEDDVADKILEDAGDISGALPLVALCLSELYNTRGPERGITLRQYQKMGGLSRAIDKIVDEATTQIQPRGKTLEILFSKLVTVDRYGHAVRRRPNSAEFEGDEAVKRLVWDLSNDPDRLLTVTKDTVDITKDTVELVHDALMEKWPALEQWIERNRADMRLRAELEDDANNWLQSSRDKNLLWKGKKLQDAIKLLKREPSPVPPSPTMDTIQQFITASRRARRRRWKYALLVGLALAIVPIAVIMVYLKPSLEPKRAMPVGRFDSNPFGLYDVLGNVWEWTEKCLEVTSKDSSGRAMSIDNWCLARGGSWDNYDEWQVRASYSLALARTHRGQTVGFRVAREVNGKEPRGKVPNCEECFSDCTGCPEMVILPGGLFMERRPPKKMETEACERAQEVEVSKVQIDPFAIGRYEVTVKEWNVFRKAKYREEGASEDQTNEHRPITNVSWDDAKEYVQWLNSHLKKQYQEKQDGPPPKPYRLPSSPEWEYAARGNKDTCRWWGNELGHGKANCTACKLTWEQFLDWFGLLSIKDKLIDYKNKMNDLLTRFLS